MADPHTPATDPASVRSQAVAKLRRAASLPRNKNGRRPATPAEDVPASPSLEGPPPSTSAFAQLAQQQQQQQQQGQTSEPQQHQEGDREGHDTTGVGGELGGEGEEENSMDWASRSGEKESLGPIPSFEDDAKVEDTVPSPPPAQPSPSLPLPAALSSSFSFASQPSSPSKAHFRSASASSPSTSFFPSVPSRHTPSASMSSNINANSSDASDPIPYAPPAQQQRFALPSLQSIQTRHLLQRSNSEAARMLAMSKLTGIPVQSPSSSVTSSQPLVVIPASPARDLASVSQVGSVSANAIQELSSEKLGKNGEEQPSEEVKQELLHPEAAAARPRMGRSQTISGGGEERRSAVGRRMMLRLGSRVATPTGSAANSRAMSPAASRETSPTRRDREAKAERVEKERLVQEAELGGAHSPVIAPEGFFPLTASNFPSSRMGQASTPTTPLFNSSSPTSPFFDRPFAPQATNPPPSATAPRPSRQTRSASLSSHLHQPNQYLSFPPSSSISPSISPSSFNPYSLAPIPTRLSTLSSSSYLSASSASHATQDTHNMGGGNDHTADAFEFAAHLKRTNSTKTDGGRTTRSISPMPPFAGGFENVDEMSAEMGPGMERQQQHLGARDREDEMETLLTPGLPPDAYDGSSSNSTQAVDQEISRFTENKPLSPSHSSKPFSLETPPRTFNSAARSSSPPPPNVALTNIFFTPTSVSTDSSSRDLSPGIPIMLGKKLEPSSREKAESFPTSLAAGDILRSSGGEEEMEQNEETVGGGRDVEQDEAPPASTPAERPELVSRGSDVSPGASPATTSSLLPARASEDRGHQRSGSKSSSRLSGGWEMLGGAPGSPSTQNASGQQSKLKRSGSVIGKIEKLAKGLRSRSGSLSANHHSNANNSSSSGNLSMSKGPDSPSSVTTGSRSSVGRSPVAPTRDLSASRTVAKTASSSSGSSGDKKSESSHLVLLPPSPEFSTATSGRGSPLPPVSPSDAKYRQDSKLSPFPGMVKLEEQRRARGASISNASPSASSPAPAESSTSSSVSSILLHPPHQQQQPMVDSPSSIVGSPFPSSAFSTSAESPLVQQSYFDIPPRAPSPPTGKEKKSSWLQKKFSTGGLGSSREKKRPSVSGESPSRKGSEASLGPSIGESTSSSTSSTGGGAGVGVPVPPPMVTQDSTSSFVSAVSEQSASSASTSRMPSSFQDFRTAPSSPVVPTGTNTTPTPTPTNNPSPAHVNVDLPSPRSHYDSLPPSSSPINLTPQHQPALLPSPTLEPLLPGTTRVSTVLESAEMEDGPGERGVEGEGHDARHEHIAEEVYEGHQPIEAATDHHQLPYALIDEPELRLEDLRSPVLSKSIDDPSDPSSRLDQGDSSSVEGGYESEAEDRAGPLAPSSSSTTAPPPAPSSEGGHARGGAAPLWPQATSDVLGRLDRILGVAAANKPAGGRLTQLEDPPRKLLLHCPVLQVVNINTVKDRYLFLFSDILIIAKPILGLNDLPSLEKKFIVKSIVELHKLKLSGIKDDEGISDSSKKQHPVVSSFIEMFARDPASAIEHLSERSNLQPDNMASLLYKTSELDKSRLGEFLSARQNRQFMKGFVSRFPFSGVRVDEALRIFLLSVRLPAEANAGETLLTAFATRWYEANSSVIAFDKKISIELVLAIMQLNDALNPSRSFGFAFANQAITVDDFIQAFRVKDTTKLVRDDLLEALYKSIQRGKLCQALASSEAHLVKDIVCLPTQINTRLTYKMPSQPITISIPEPDARLTIRLHGAGLRFEPSILDFSKDSRASFRITGTSLGQKTVLFSRVGDNAPLYAGLPASKNFSVERAFMKTGHTFQLAFLREPTNTKRKYLFSFEYPDVRSQWVARLQSQIATCLRNVSSRTNSPAPGPISPQVRSAAEAVALQVLRDALIPTNATEAQTPLRGVLQPPPSTSRNENGNVKQKSHARQASSSVVYSRQAGRGEIDLDEKIEREKAKAAAAAAANSSTSGKGRPRTGGGDGGGKSPSGIGGGARVDEAEALREAEELAETPFLKAQTGREIAMLCQQNSLIPLMLAFLQSGIAAQTPAASSQPGGYRNPSSNAPLAGLGITAPPSSQQANDHQSNNNHI